MNGSKSDLAKERSVSRRTIVKGVAWSIPVVAVSAAVPGATASTGTVCGTPPVLSMKEAWVVRHPAQGTLRDGGAGWVDGFYQMANGSGVAWYQIWDCNSNPQNAVITLTSTIDVVKGCALAFTFEVISNGGQTDHTKLYDALASFEVNGSVLWSGSTSNGIPLYSEQLAPNLPMRGQQYTVTYTPTATGKVDVVIRITLPVLPNHVVSNDDIAFTLPTVVAVS